MKMRISILAAAVLGIALLAGTVLAQSQSSACEQAKARTPQKLEGQVVKVDVDRGKLTVRSGDGTTHEFQADKETLQGYKVGDRIEAKLRSGPTC